MRSVYALECLPIVFAVQQNRQADIVIEKVSPVCAKCLKCTGPPDHIDLFPVHRRVEGVFPSRP